MLAQRFAYKPIFQRIQLRACLEVSAENIMFSVDGLFFTGYIKRYKQKGES